MYFEDLHDRLLEIARERVRSGLVSESGLARASGISQPHLHNALKKIRTLSPPAVDRLMRALEVTLAALVWHRPGGIEEGVSAVPRLRMPLGPGMGPEFGTLAGQYPVPSFLLRGLGEPLIATLSPDLVLPRLLEAGDVVLLDQNHEVRRTPDRARTCWVVREQAGLRARYVMRREGVFYLANEETLARPERWQPVPGPPGNILEIVRARIVWISREMETQPAGPADATGPFD